MAASLAKANVAVLVEMSSSHGRGLIRGVAQYAQRQTNWTLHLEESGPLRASPGWLKTWSGAGIIARIETPAIARAVLGKRIPVINVSGRTSPPGVPHVDMDNRAACDLIVEYFSQRGYRNFAFCGNPKFEWSSWRHDLFTRRLGKDRIFAHSFQLYDHHRNASALIAWLNSLPKPVALFACNDLCGRYVLEACEQARLAVPDQISVLGIDDDDILCTLCRPQLSSVVPDTEGIGYLAAKTLHSLMRGEKIPEQPPLVPPLTVRTRESTDSAASSDWHVSQALRFIHGHATRDICVNDIVAQVHTSRRFLEKQFTQITGRSLHDEILRVRFETSQRLLTTTTLPLKEVAARSGFRRADYLSSIFRNKLNLTPSQYRDKFAAY
ncbi:MAG TPA: DNA-binding transcriptional regulator [Verrucomicrobiae bacterium]|nr:DNA-binding transcriptional regulator [Verrucomicrobiae bacterium]